MRPWLSGVRFQTDVCRVGSVVMIAFMAVLSVGCTTPEADSASTNSETRESKAQSSTQDQATAEVPVEGVKVHRWSTRMRPDETVRITNSHGDIRVKNSSDSGLIFAGSVQNIESDQRVPEFGTNRFADGLALTVSAPENWRGRVDAGVRVPKDASLELTTTSGLIETRLGENSVDATSKSGLLALRTGGRIMARTDSGLIRATFESPQYDQVAGELVSRSGDIEVWVHPDAALRIVARSGSITNSISADLTVQEATVDGSTKFTMGSDGASLTLATESGSISLNVFPVPVPQ